MTTAALAAGEETLKLSKAELATGQVMELFLHKYLDFEALIAFNQAAWLANGSCVTLLGRCRLRGLNGLTFRKLGPCEMPAQT
jgi:hypothetical protein